MEEHLASLTKGERIELAVAACSRENGPSARKAAKVYDVAPSTITRRLNHSVQSATSVHQSRQRLSPTEEQVVIQKAIHYYESGLPLGIRHLHEFANEILTRKDPDAPEIGQNWHKKLLARNPLLERVLSRPPDRVRTTVVTRKNTLEGFFKLYSELRKTHGIALNDVYNMDEKGFLMGPIQPSHVLIPIQEKHAYLYQDEGREWISVSECISADGEALPAWVVFKADNQQNSWSTYLSTGNSEFATSENGWTDNDLELNWLQEHFHPLTEKRRHGEFRMLIVDGHESHCKPEFIDFCVNNKIILLILPPHNTHLVRPLDGAVFQPLAKAYNILLDDHNQFCGNSLTRECFAKYYQMARSEAVNRANIMSGWRKTGLFPFNPQEVLHQQRGPLSNLPQTRPVSTTLYSDQP
jgi:hypothetical protein